MRNKKDENIVYGRNPVIELLKSNHPIDKILIWHTSEGGSIAKIISMAKEKNVLIKNVSKEKLNTMSLNENHQNVVAVVAAYNYSELEDIFQLAKQKDEAPFIIILDKITDPHNMGAIIRTAEVVGAHGVIIPKRHNVGITPVVMKVSAGACKSIPIVRVANLAETISFLKEQGVWVYCLEACGESYVKFDYKGSLAVVVGSEGKGVSRLVKERCDFVVSLPVNGRINSLNASVAAGVFMYEVARQRIQFN